MLKIITGNNASSYDGVLSPDANIHPNKLINLASKMVLMGKYYNITIITYNPMLIEAISVIAIYCNMKKEQLKFFINDKEISYDDMGAIYEELCSPYDTIDEIKANNLFACKFGLGE